MLRIEGQTVLLEAGDSWVVPRGAAHQYKILTRFTAVEATSPPAFAHGRDQDGEVESGEAMERAMYDL